MKIVKPEDYKEQKAISAPNIFSFDAIFEKEGVYKSISIDGGNVYFITFADEDGEDAGTSVVCYTNEDNNVHSVSKKQWRYYWGDKKFERLENARVVFGLVGI